MIQKYLIVTLVKIRYFRNFYFTVSLQKNQTAMEILVYNLKKAVNDSIAGGSPKDKLRHISKGKLLVRDRINYLLDSGSPFLELSQLAGHNLYEETVPCGGIVTGIGRISG